MNDNDKNDNDNHTTSLTVSQAWSLWQTSQRAVQEARHVEAEALRTVVRAAGGKTFLYEGQLYQVRERVEKRTCVPMPYICKLKKPPQEWLADARAARYQDAAADSGTSEQLPENETPEPDGSPLVLV